MDEHTAQVRPFNHAGFTAYLAERKLMGTRCAGCGQIFLPPRQLCPRCYRTDMEWVELSGEGTLEGFTAISVGLPDMIAAGYNREKPYCAGIVRLAEGPAISGQIVAEDGACPAEIAVGMPLRAVFLRRGQETILAFEKDRS